MKKNYLFDLKSVGRVTFQLKRQVDWAEKEADRIKRLAQMYVHMYRVTHEFSYTLKPSY